MILVVQSMWNESITGEIAKGAEKVLQEKDVSYEVIQVPGALEIPLAIKWAWTKARRNQSEVWGVIACGTVIKGETHHFEIVANESARKLSDLSLELSLPIANAILAVYNTEQALERIGGKHGHKGEEAADAVLSMRRLQKSNDY